MKILTLVSLFLSLHLFAQEQQYQLKGSIGTHDPFTLKWTEKDGKAMGTFSDNLYADSAVARGISGDLGRIFVVTFPEEINGVRTITFLGSDLKGDKGSALIPLTVVLRDDTGKPISSTIIEANLTGMNEIQLAQRQEEKCRDGFGALSGYCGIYSGMLVEELDPENKCNLLSFNNSRFVLDENAEIGLSLGQMSAIINPPIHRIGRVFTDIDSTSVDLLSRTCKPLPGISFNGDDCKRLHLFGVFSSTPKVKHFLGKYSITDEKTNESCRYSLSMDQEL
jgi:hypothetical protein